MTRMNYPIWTKRIACLLGFILIIYLLGIFFFGPPILARNHPFTWDLGFEQKVERLASTVSSEEELIDALRRRGFEMWMRPEDPIDGNMTSYKDRSRNYTTYDDFVQRHERFQAAFPDNFRIHPRIAEASYGFISCAHKFYIKWQLKDGKIVDLKANEHWVCL